MMDFLAFQKQYTPQIDAYLKKQLAAEVDNDQLAQIMAYSVMAGGKRLRPLLFLATCQALGQELSEQTLRAACGIELIHTYSLIHDDLPAMDDSPLRRGKPASHVKWGEAQAILAGDGLLPLGLQWLAEGTGSAQAVALLAQAIGPNGMVGGQYLDIDATNNAAVAGDQAFIDRMEWRKTGCLLLACVQVPVTWLAAAPTPKKRLLIFAKDFGRAYQIYDDLVDVFETSQEAGKNTHEDAAGGKNNTLTLLGVKKSQEELAALIDQAQQTLSGDYEVLAGFLDLYQRVLP